MLGKIAGVVIDRAVEVLKIDVKVTCEILQLSKPGKGALEKDLGVF